MSAATAICEGAHGRLGAMVRTATELFIYWKPVAACHGLRFRVHDVTGRPMHDLLDGSGRRDLPAAEACYVADLIPGHLYYVEVGRHTGAGFDALMGVGPVQTPWKAIADTATFPDPYHRS